MEGEAIMDRITRKGMLAAGAALLLAGCTSSGNPFANPFGGQPRPQPVAVQPSPAPAPAAQSAGVAPSIAINASQKRVQDTIVSRAQRRGTNVLGANASGVTLEIPLRQSSEVVTQQCGPHRDGRTIRVYLETVPTGPSTTTVNEQRFIIDGGTSTCALSLLQGDVDEANRSLADLKRESEQRRTASAAGGAPGGARASDPQGGLEALDPRRPVRPLQ
jgi:hypothetical protein